MKGSRDVAGGSWKRSVIWSNTPGGEHTHEFPKEELDSASKLERDKIAKMVAAGGTVAPDVDEPTPEDAPAPPVPTSKYIPILLLSQPSAPQLFHPDL